MMKAFQRFLLVLGITAVLVGVVWLSPYGYLIKGLRMTYLIGEKSANYLDYKGFDKREVANDPERVSVLAVSEDAGTVELSSALREMLKRTNSGSFLVFRNDSLVCERYFEPVADTVMTNSFSMAKTITCLLFQRAIEEGKIASWDEPVRKFLPWVGKAAVEKGEAVDGVSPDQMEANAAALTLRHLITMSAGLQWNESYQSPFGITAKAYYGSDIEATMREVPVVVMPGTQFEYQSGSTQLLGLVLEQVTGKHLSDLASDWLWKPLGMEAPAYWSLDKANGRELNFCCVNARSRDFGRLGLMVLHNGKGLVDSGFLAMARKPFEMGGKTLVPFYGHSFWLGSVDGVDFQFFNGLKGQYIVVIPSKNMVVVRTGHGVVKPADGGRIFDCVKLYVGEAVRMFGR
ncbi:MAG: serine hydrolase domain-containing protein [Bacteroidota bacterium]|jgi:CubicO group peptidase (beta-lactamase class C family)|nr:beta-lactamase family protein [Bacteroidota bacterium]